MYVHVVNGFFLVGEHDQNVWKPLVLPICFGSVLRSLRIGSSGWSATRCVLSLWQLTPGHGWIWFGLRRLCLGRREHSVGERALGFAQALSSRLSSGRAVWRRWQKHLKRSLSFLAGRVVFSLNWLLQKHHPGFCCDFVCLFLSYYLASNNSLWLVVVYT